MYIRTCSVLLALLAGLSHVAAQPNASFAILTEGAIVEGFRAEALYVNDADSPIGARFVHGRTGFTFDLLQIQSVPQSFVWVNSFPTSDMGEPHTQEHLLLGKGNRGRYVGSLESMLLTSSSAFTMQWRTCYHSHTGAGTDAFFTMLDQQLDALLHPDYSDEEIHREVANFGVTDNSATGTLGLEEKGTVYNEMVSTFERGWTRMSREIDLALYGPRHPLSYVSGGLPSAIRVMQPEAIRKFHRDNYHLGNMGMVGAFPKEIAYDVVLRRVGGILDRLQPERPKRPVTTERDLPSPEMAPPGIIRIVGYPSENANQPGPLLFAWPPMLTLSLEEQQMLDLFLDNIAGDATTELYRKFIDTRTRKIDIGATSVFAWASGDQGHPVYIGLGNVDPANMTEEKIRLVREGVQEEIRRIALLSDDSPELADFNRRMLNRVVESRRDLSNFVASPPGFGSRGTGAGWMEHLRMLERSKGFSRSLTLKGELKAVEQQLSGKKNIWREHIRRWKLAETMPYAAAARPDPALITREAGEREERIAAEVARLKSHYGVSDDQQAIGRYRDEYDAMTRHLDSVAAGVETPRFIDNPPLTIDDGLDYTVTSLPGRLPAVAAITMVASRFDGMASGTVGLALRLDDVPERDHLYLSLLAALLTDVGVIENGEPVAYDRMRERLRAEVLGINAYYSVNPQSGRYEIVLRGSGNNLSEAGRAMDWLELFLFNPDWRPENLPRIRDLVDQSLSNLRGTMQGSEESWVDDPAAAWRRSKDPLYLTTSSFLTQIHNIHRLRWQLKDAGSDKERRAIGEFLDRFGRAASILSTPQDQRRDLSILLRAIGGDGDGVKNVTPRLQEMFKDFKSLPEGARLIAIEAAGDLDRTLGDIPDESLSSDWAYLCRQMREDLLVPPAEVLNRLNQIRKRIVRRKARAFAIGSEETLKMFNNRMRALARMLPDGEPDIEQIKRSESSTIISRLADRGVIQPGSSTSPLFVGLVNPNTGSGVVLNSASGTRYEDTDRESLLRFLSAMLYSGHGAHGIFIKTWGAGLAYSNGARVSPRSGRINYYAERCPALPQTIGFVINELKRASLDTSLVEYAVAQAFSEFRGGSSYEWRGEAMADDLADGLTPDVVSRFRRAILELRSEPALAREIFDRMESVYGSVLPGYGPKASEAKDGIFFIIGPEKQFELYEQYLRSVEGNSTKLYRLYPRDFWIRMDEEPLKEAPPKGGQG